MSRTDKTRPYKVQKADRFVKRPIGYAVDADEPDTTPRGNHYPHTVVFNGGTNGYAGAKYERKQSTRRQRQRDREFGIEVTKTSPEDYDALDRSPVY